MSAGTLAEAITPTSSGQEVAAPSAKRNAVQQESSSNSPFSDAKGDTSLLLPPSSGVSGSAS